MGNYKEYEITEIAGQTVVLAGRSTLLADFITDIEQQLNGKVDAGTKVYLWQPERYIPNRVFACVWDGQSLGTPDISKTEMPPEEYFEALAA